MTEQAHNTGVEPTASDLLDDLYEKITAKVQAGEGPDLEAYARKFPEYADQLRELARAIGVLADLGLSISGEGSTATRPVRGEPVSGVLGDFRIQREIGRGGMGVVYEAEQISLGRKVALKVLPFAAMLDQRQLARFQNEARAAASLDHPNIVNVYSVGCERGVHYYAMRYIEGRTLAEVIQQGRGEGGDGVTGRRGDKVPTPPATDSPPHTTDTSPLGLLSTEGSSRSSEYSRSVAQLGVQAAGALEHAHQMGVVHRDIKPSNLMVDTTGHLWVTDFGLAMVETGPDLTMTGDVLGTLRYMSPEQAEGGRHVLDHRTDVYSLGLTLYELLTLQAAFDGSGRQALLRRILQDEPIPPRRLNPAIPADLETIVLKSIAKNPAERYATAGDLADDLQRFLADEPIRARRPSLATRAAKWSRRHRPIVGASVATLLIAVVALAVSTLLIAGAYEDEKEQRALAGQQRQRAEGNEAEARSQAAKANTVVELLQELLASGNPEQARGKDYTVRQLLDDFAAGLGDRLEDQPVVEATVRATIGRAHWCLGMNEEAGPHLRKALDLRRRVFGNRHHLVAESLVDYAWYLWKLRQREAAEAHVREAVAICRGQPEQIAPLLKAFHALAQFLVWQDSYAEADAVMREAMALADEAGAQETIEAAHILHASADSSRRQGLFAEGASAERKAIDIYRKAARHDHPDTAWALVSLAKAEQAQEEYAAAETHYRESLAIFRKCYDDDYRPVGRILLYLAEMSEEQGKIEEAEKTASGAIQPDSRHASLYSKRGLLYKRLEKYDEALADFDKAIELGTSEAWVYRNRGKIYGDQKKQYDKALADFDQAIRLSPKPEGWLHSARADVYKALDRHEEALADLDQAIELGQRTSYRYWLRGDVYAKLGRYEEAVADYDRSVGVDPSARNWVAYKRRGLANFQLGHYDEALADFAKLVELKPSDTNSVAWISPTLVAACPDEEFKKGMLALADKTIELTNGSAAAYVARGSLYSALKQHDKAAADYEKAIESDPKHVGSLNIVAWLLVTCPEEEFRDANRAVELATKAVDLEPNAWHIWNTLGVAQYRAGDWSAAIEALEKSIELSSGGNSFDFFFLAMAHWQLDHKDEARNRYKRAVEWMDENKPDDEDLIRFRQEAQDLLNVADTDKKPESPTEDVLETDEPNTEAGPPSTDQEETTDDE